MNPGYHISNIAVFPTVLEVALPGQGTSMVTTDEGPRKGSYLAILVLSSHAEGAHMDSGAPFRKDLIPFMEIHHPAPPETLPPYTVLCGVRISICHVGGHTCSDQASLRPLGRCGPASTLMSVQGD